MRVVKVVCSAIAAGALVYVPVQTFATGDGLRHGEQDYEEARIALVHRTTDALKREARNPDSIVFERMRTNREGTVACALYQARNTMGRTSTWSIVAVNDKITNDKPELVKRHCRPDMVDMLHAVG